MPFTYCEMFPGKIAMKNNAVARPIYRRYCRDTNAMPRPISTTPDASTTKSAENGTQFGT
jgi:hypothetical protein